MDFDNIEKAAYLKGMLVKWRALQTDLKKHNYTLGADGKIVVGQKKTPTNVTYIIDITDVVEERVLTRILEIQEELRELGVSI